MSIFIPKTRPASPDSIANLEKEAGLKLPQSYLLFLKEHDGAKPEDNVFSLGERNSAGIDEFIPAHKVIYIRDVVEGFPKKMLPIARATAGNFVYIDPPSGAVYFWDHEKDSVDIKLAESFDIFLSELKQFDASQVKLKPEQVKKVWVNPNFKPKF